MAASKQSAELLHDALCNAFADLMKNGVKAMDNDGVLQTVTAPAAYLNVVRQFLKDNDIKCAPVDGKPMANLLADLPFAGDDHPANQTEH